MAPKNNMASEDPNISGLKNLANQVLSSANPQASFNQMIESNPNGKAAMSIVQEYGNGDPKAAFMNYAASQGKQALASQILAKLGLQ